MNEIEANQANERADRDVPWTAYVDTILRWRRLILGGLTASWLLLGLGAILWPRTYIGEATISLPNIAFAESRPKIELDEAKARPSAERQEANRIGVPVGTYKKIESALTDEALLKETLDRTLPADKVERVRRNLGQIVSPITTGARDEIVRTEHADSVTAIRLSFSSLSDREVLGTVNALATLIREAVCTRVARDRVEESLLQATSTASWALQRRLDLSARNESLKGLAADLLRLAAAGPSGTASGREVVDLAAGGHRYLPAAVQLVGAKAWQADNEYEMRQADWTFRVESLRVAFYRRLQGRLRNADTQTEAAVVADIPTVIDAELRAFLANQKGPAADYLRAEAEALRDVIQSHRSATVFVQRPSLRTTPRLPWVAASLVAATLSVLLAALVGESWRRYHESAS